MHIPFKMCNIFCLASISCALSVRRVGLAITILKYAKQHFPTYSNTFLSPHEPITITYFSSWLKLKV